jgi:hypothetical protein
VASEMHGNRQFGRHKTKQDHERAVRKFIDFFGDKPIGKVDRSAALSFIDGLAENAGGILHHVSGEIVLSQMGRLACPVRLFVLTEGGIEARGIVWARSSRCSC